MPLVKEEIKIIMKIDTHIHSIASGHAFNTINEIMQESKKKGLELIAITDHGPNMEGGPHAGYFSMGNRVPKKFDNIEILFGCEANIINSEGTIDLSYEIIKKLDILLVGFHELTKYSNQGIKENTRALINALEKYPIDIVSHPYRKAFPICVQEVAYYAAKNNILLELNNSLFTNASIETIEYTRDLIRYMKKYKGKAIIGSDAHILNEIGNDFAIRKLSDELEIEGLEIICDRERLLEFLKRRH